ncbi:uncharacterized protein BP01DRAFT_365101 [Aspergillus saccharolyticus JOP 1030-1]|uniref:Uncharacterized protein n=1 Tax=Aspergillus saccharolyticus JOP 1030-1 TaxID=1450539 RepID=A0A318ZHW2_9EURO|nr:hypothetical protein BP01DRAFT_365101 [Aspergillus saccharolyticus JOP 1030-1]PYH46357.1 hypothetical protein BP01DRAFT_365101 [Aspergillus saccharolyticus JOP 1030-1]
MPLALVSRRTRLSHTLFQPFMRSLQKRSHALSLPARVGLALGLLAAVMLGVFVSTWIVLRVKRGPGVTLWTLFSRQPIPARSPESDPCDPAAVEAGKSLDDRLSDHAHDDDDHHHHLSQPSHRRRVSNVSPRRMSRRMSQTHEYLTLPEKPTDSSSPTTTTAARPAQLVDRAPPSPGSPYIPLRPIARLGPVRTMSEADIRRDLPAPPSSPFARAAGLRTSTRSAGMAAPAPQAIRPPAFDLPWKKEEFYVPDSPEDHIIVLPSPRDLKTFRLTLQT